MTTDKLNSAINLLGILYKLKIIDHSTYQLTAYHLDDAFYQKTIGKQFITS